MLERARRYRSRAAVLFISLVALVSAERRLSEAHFNLRTAATGLESDDVLDGDDPPA